VVPSNIPAKLQYYLKIIHIKSQVVYSKVAISIQGVQVGHPSKKPLGFYVYWVVRFLKYYQNRPSKPSAQIVSSYIEAMETDSRFADWQVKQAADAILLYTDIPIRRESEFRVSPGVGVIV
jgi:hypothetical protein